MRKQAAIVIGLLVIGVGTHFTVSTKANAGPAIPTATANPPPPPHINVPPALLNIRRSDKSTYSDGPLSYDVEISNQSSTALKTELTVSMTTPIPGVGPVITKVPVNIEPNARAWVTYVDPGGVRDGCRAASAHDLTLATGQSRRVLTKPTCSFTSEVVDPTASLPQATKAALRANKIYYADPTLTSAPKCGSPLSVRASITNSSSIKANDARLLLDLPGPGSLPNTDVGGPESPKVDIEPNTSSRPLSVTWSFDGLFSKPGNYTLRVKGGGAPEYQWGWNVKVGRMCTLVITWDN